MQEQSVSPAGNEGGDVLSEVPPASAIVPASVASLERNEIVLPVDFLSDAFCEVEMSGRILRWNQAYLYLTGYTAEEITGFSNAELTPGQWHAAEADIVARQVLVRGYSDSYTKEYRRKDGSIVPVELRTYRVDNPDGSPKGMWSLIRELSERKQAEKALMNAAREWRMTFDAVSNGICLLDREMRIIRANRAFADLVGMSVEALPGQHCWAIAHGSDHPHPDCPTLRMLVSKKAETGEIRVGSRWFLVTVDPLFDESGELSGAVHVMRDISDHKIIHDNLRRSESLLEDAQRMAHIGSFQMEADTDRVVWSKEMYRIFEVPDFSPPLGFDEISALVHPADTDVFRAKMEQLKGDFAEVRADFRTAFPNGLKKNLRLIAQKLRDEQGRSAGVSGTVMDVTAEIMSREEQVRDERRLALLLEMSGMKNVPERELFEWALEAIVSLTNSTGGYLHLYDEAAQTILLTAWSSSVRKQCKISEGQHYPLAHAGIWADSIRTRDVIVHNDYAVAHGKKGLPDGHFPLIRHLGVPVFDGDLIVAAAGVSNKDDLYTASDIRQIQFFMDGMWKIIARNRAEKRLAESESAFRGLFEASQDGVFRVGIDGRVERANKSCARIFGHAIPDEMIGRLLTDYWDNELEHSVYMAMVRQNGHIQSFPFRAVRPNGDVRRLEVTANLVRNDDGAHIATEGIVRDVTEQHQLTEQLRHAQKMEAVGRLAGGIAHDFNNIISAMVGFASLPLMAGKVTATERNTLQQIIGLAERASTLTKGLLAFSRRQVLTMKPTDLNQIIGVTAKLLGRLIGEDIALVVHEAAQPLPVQADSGQLEQVLMNLATNARDAMPGGGTLTLEAGRVSLAEHEVEGLSSGDYARILLADTGTGIAPEHMNRIFEPFFTTKEEGKGTGLGLASVYGIMQQHGGAVTVTSGIGAGTTFLLYLPISTAAGESMGDHAAESIPGGTETILLAEDDIPLRHITKKILMMRGYTVLEAENGAKAIAVCETAQGAIDLLLSDVVMPELGGFEAWRIIHERYPATKVVFMSGYVSDEGKRATIEQLGITCIPKPFEPRQILSAIRKELDRG